MKWWLPRFLDSRRWLRWGIVGVLILGLVGGGLLVLKRRDFREWRAQGLARESLDSLAEGDFQTAQYQAMAAFQISPTNPEVLRASARLNARAGHPQTLAFYSALLATGKANEEDRIGFIEAALRAGEWDSAAEQMDNGEWTEAAKLRLMELRAALRLSRGDPGGAEALWRERGMRTPAEVPPKLALADLLLQSGNSESIAEAVGILSPLAADHPAAARLLLQPAVPAAQRQAEAERIFAAPTSESLDRLAAAEILIHLDPARLNGVLAELAPRFPPNQPEAFRNYCAWLVQIGEARAALDRLNLTTALQRKDYFLVWLDAQGALGNWDLIQSVLSTRELPLEPALVSLFLGRAAQERGQSDAASHYERALAAAGRNLELLLYLAAYFHRSGQSDQSERALRLLTLDPATAMPAYQALLNQYREAADTPSVLATLKEMALRWPTNAAVQNDLRYVELLLAAQPVSSLLPKSREAFEQDPGQFPFRMTYALALLKAEQPNEALALFQDSAVKLGQLLPWQRAILSATLRANGMDEGATAVAESILPGSLSSEEEALVRPAKP